MVETVKLSDRGKPKRKKELFIKNTNSLYPNGMKATCYLRGPEKIVNFSDTAISVGFHRRINFDLAV